MTPPDALFPYPAPGPRPRSTLAPGAVHVPGWLDAPTQRHLVEACRAWVSGPAPMRRVQLPSGHYMSVQTAMLGVSWRPYRYLRTDEDTELPTWLVALARQAVADAYLEPPDPAYAPDAALINFYDDGAHMGMHQDKDERVAAPVVSLSLGDTCVFRFGNTETRSKPYTDVQLASGDLVVFGGPSRFAFHGVPKVLPGSGPGRDAIGLASGRLNITLRTTGLSLHPLEAAR